MIDLLNSNNVKYSSLQTRSFISQAGLRTNHIAKGLLRVMCDNKIFILSPILAEAVIPLTVCDDDW